MIKNLHLLLAVVIITVFSAHAQDLIKYPERDALSKPDTTAGSSLLLTASPGFVSPEDYYIGPGDVFTILVAGIQQNTFNATVDISGNCFVPGAGIIELKNLNLARASKKIESALKLIYKNVEVYSTLSQIRKIKVSLLGQLNKPGSYVVSAATRLLDLINISQGIRPDADIRNITVTRSNGTREKVDLLRFLRLGELKSNPYIFEGDFVFIDKVDRVISVSGAVKQPGTYEYVENEKLSDLIEICRGLRENARQDSLEVIKFRDDNITQYSVFVNYRDLLKNDLVIQNRDRVVVREIPLYLREDIVTLSGFVVYPGEYAIIDNVTTIKELIERAGGFIENADLSSASVRRYTGNTKPDPEFERLKLIPREAMTEDEYDYYKSVSRKRIGKVVVDFKKLFKDNDTRENIKLRRNDEINVPESKLYITIIGQAVSPGNIPYEPEYKVMDYINLAGGFGWRAEDSEIRVIRANTGEWIDAEDVDVLYPGDTIWIPEETPGPKFWDVFKDTLTILGQVATVITAAIAIIVSSR